uniref:Uncharacterized protein n=1 Tax=Rhizophora mucronata TaxID=61149 RepID=A0A2P2QXZ1_RHIMU
MSHEGWISIIKNCPIFHNNNHIPCHYKEKNY